jgi:hypothetical protein
VPASLQDVHPPLATVFATQAARWRNVAGTLSSCRAMSVHVECAHGGLQQRQQAGAAAFQLQRAPVGRIVQQAAAVQLLQHMAAAVALAHCTLRQ